MTRKLEEFPVEPHKIKTSKYILGQKNLNYARFGDESIHQILLVINT